MFAYLIYAIAPDQRLQNIFFSTITSLLSSESAVNKRFSQEQLDCILALNVVPPYWNTGCNGKPKIFHRNCYSPRSISAKLHYQSRWVCLSSQLRQTFSCKYRPLNGVPPPPPPTRTGLSMEFKGVQWGKRKLIWPPIRPKNSQKRPNSLLEGFSSKHEAVLYIQ